MAWVAATTSSGSVARRPALRREATVARHPEASTEARPAAAAGERRAAAAAAWAGAFHTCNLRVGPAYRNCKAAVVARPIGAHTGAAAWAARARTNAAAAAGLRAMSRCAEVAAAEADRVAAAGREAAVADRRSSRAARHGLRRRAPPPTAAAAAGARRSACRRCAGRPRHLLARAVPRIYPPAGHGTARPSRAARRAHTEPTGCCCSCHRAMGRRRRGPRRRFHTGLAHACRRLCHRRCSGREAVRRIRPQAAARRIGLEARRSGQALEVAHRRRGRQSSRHTGRRTDRATTCRRAGSCRCTGRARPRSRARPPCRPHRSGGDPHDCCCRCSSPHQRARRRNRPDARYAARAPTRRAPRPACAARQCPRRPRRAPADAAGRRRRQPARHPGRRRRRRPLPAGPTSWQLTPAPAPRRPMPRLTMKNSP